MSIVEVLLPVLSTLLGLGLGCLLIKLDFHLQRRARLRRFRAAMDDLEKRRLDQEEEMAELRKQRYQQAMDRLYGNPDEG